MDLVPHAAVQVVCDDTFCKNSIASSCPKDVHFRAEKSKFLGKCGLDFS
jgi:hypothetical protein